MIQSDNVTTKAVVIIGCGAAGIAASRTLRENGFTDIVVLEGRNRIGGRVFSQAMYRNLDDNSSNGLNNYVSINLGANWIHGLDDSNPLYKISQQLKYNLHITSGDHDPGDDVILFDANSNNYDANFSKIEKNDYNNAVNRYEWIKDYYYKHFSDWVSTKETSLGEAFEICIEASNNHLGICSEQVLHCLYWFLERIAIDLAADLSDCDFRAYFEHGGDGDDDEETEYREALMINGNYTMMLESLLHEFDIDVKLNHIVTDITIKNATSPIIEILCSNGYKVHCNKCVVTVPIPLLQKNKINFQPSPSTKIIHYCNTLQQGLLNLVWIWYPHKFWLRHPHHQHQFNFIGIIKKSQQDNLLFNTFLTPPMKDNYGNDQAIIMCQITGSNAYKIEMMSENEIAKQITITMCHIFGEKNVPNPIGCVKSSWNNDNMAEGSYTFVPTLSSLSLMYANINHKNVEEENNIHNDDSDTSNTTLETLTDTSSTSNMIDQCHIDECIFYAGEADYPQSRGTVHGAYISGTLAAKEIIKSLLELKKK